MREDLAGVHLGLQADLGRVHADLGERAEAIQTLVRYAYDDEQANRRRLQALRATEEYQLAFTEREPLVSFVIPTYTGWESLRDVALPSVLGQSYPNIEVVVVGDAAPPETAAAIEQIGDERVRYFNRTVRGPYPANPKRRWYVAGTPPYNDAIALARGRWIAGLGDDDAVRPEHTRLLVAEAQRSQCEHCYGLQQIQFAEGEPIEVGEFPPRIGHFGLQASIYHAGLRFFGMPLGDAVAGEPNDWSLCRRMLDAGVSFAIVDEVVADKHESRRRSAAEWERGEVPRVD